MVRVKICGITNLEDAVAAVSAGADALGFVFHRASPRYVPPELVRVITGALPPFVARVGVFVDRPLEEVVGTLDFCRLDFAQLHGVEDGAFCAALAPRAIKALRVGHDDLRSLSCFEVAAFVLDTYKPGIAGGTGAAFDWSLARKAANATTRPIVLSGGLNAGNVAQAVAVARPFAVDVASGVEVCPGRKEHAKIREFVAAAKWGGRSA